MTLIEFANRLNGREFGKEFTDEDKALAIKHGFGVIFGREVEDCYAVFDGTKEFVEYCPEDAQSVHLYLDANHWFIRALPWFGGYCWTFKTNIPHLAFDIHKDGNKYSEGIVFELSSLKNPAPRTPASPWGKFNGNLYEAVKAIKKQELEIAALKIANEKLYAANKEQEASLDKYEKRYGCLNSESDNTSDNWTTKPYKSLTIRDIEDLIQCRDANGESLCPQGCKFHFDMPWGGCCFMHAFFSNFFEYCQNLGIISDATGEWVVNKNSEGSSNDGKQDK